MRKKAAGERIMKDDFISKMTESAAGLGLSLTSGQTGQLWSYYEMLVEKNKVMNLTAITEEDEVITKHFTDSLSIVRCLDPGFFAGGPSVIDVGTGAGFPGLVLKIAFPGAKVTLFDSQKKRLLFLEEVIGALGLKGAETVHGRAEDYGHDPAYRERYDLAVSRAVANMSVLTEYCLPFVKKGGYFAAYKTADCGEEIAAAEGAVRKLGGVIKDRVSFLLPGTEIGRCLILVQHEKTTPGKYPRKAGQPSKDPLK